jgi:hypothetical protein
MKRTTLRSIALIGIGYLALALSSCSNVDSPSDATTATPQEILSTDSSNNPSGCFLPVDRLKDTLKLTDEQSAQIQAAQTSLRADAEAKIAAANGDRRAIHQILRDYHVALEAAIKNVLTAEQLALLATLRPPHTDPQHGFPCPERDSLFLARIQVDLALTDDQVVQIKALQDSIKADTTIQFPRDAFMTGLKAILTADQLAKLEAMRDRHGRDDEFDDRGHGERGRHRRH